MTNCVQHAFKTRIGTRPVVGPEGAIPSEPVVGATGIEPVTPTMSR